METRCNDDVSVTGVRGVLRRLRSGSNKRVRRLGFRSTTGHWFSIRIERTGSNEQPAAFSLAVYWLSGFTV